MKNAPIRPRFIVFAHQYNPDSGGVIALHYLCHLLNKAGFESFLIPSFNSTEISPLDPKDFLHGLPTIASFKGTSYRVHKGWETPLYKQSWRSIATASNVVVIYPEVIFGNPLRAKNIARWILCEPGFHTPEVFFTRGEIHFRYLEMHLVVPMPWIEIANQLLTVNYVPWEHYYPPPTHSPRSGTAYLVRKGINKPLVHDTTNSIKIDGMNHKQIGEIFRRVETFISYDTKTMYSPLAAIAGADSVVIPDEGVCESDWQPREELRAGLAYGFERLAWAQSTKHLTGEVLRQLELKSYQSVVAFARFWEHRLGLEPSDVGGSAENIG